MHQKIGSNMMSNQEVVLNAALPLFLRYGYRKTSMEDVGPLGFQDNRFTLGIQTRKSFYCGRSAHLSEHSKVVYFCFRHSSKNIHERLVGGLLLILQGSLSTPMRPCLPWMSLWRLPLHFCIHSRLEQDRFFYCITASRTKRAYSNTASPCSPRCLARAQIQRHKYGRVSINPAYCYRPSSQSSNLGDHHERKSSYHWSHWISWITCVYTAIECRICCPW